MELTLLLQMAVEADPDRTAVTASDGGSLSRRALLGAARQAADVFRATGATEVGYLGGNDLALPITLFGAALAGRPFVPLSYRLSDRQLGDLLDRRPGLAVVAAEPEANRARALGAPIIVPCDGLGAGDGDRVDVQAGDPDDPAVLLYTSGTTSSPKAVVLRHRHLVSYVISTVEFGSAGEDEAVLVSVPPYHIAGVSTILSNLYAGRRIVYLDPFDAVRWLDVVRTEGITHAMVVPTMLARIVEAVGEGEADVPTLRTLAYGGSATPRPVIAGALRCFPTAGFTNAYGLTETSSTVTVLGPDDHRAALAGATPDAVARLASAGRPVPGVEVRIIDDLGDPCPIGVTGHVMVRGEQVSGEYVGVASGLEDGWFRTRDRGRLDQEGYLFIEGRADDTIIRGGENIAPAEIEVVLIEHPAVEECAVVGVPDEEWTEIIAAAVVLVPGASATVDGLRTWVRDRLRSSRTPDIIDIRATLPYTETGKLLRRDLRTQLAAMRAGVGP